MEAELKRRLTILNGYKIPQITQMQLRGGMQDRLKRQELVRHGKNINTQKKNIKEKLSLIEQAKESEVFKTFSSQSTEVLDDFNEPVFRRIRSRRGFSNL